MKKNTLSEYIKKLKLTAKNSMKTKTLSEYIKKLKLTAENSMRNGYMTDDTYIELKSTYDTMQLLSTLSSETNRYANFDFYQKFQKNKIAPSAHDQFKSAVSALKPTKADLTKARKDMNEYRKSYWIQIFNDRMIRCIGHDKYKTILSTIKKNTEYLTDESQVKKFWLKMNTNDREQFLDEKYEYAYS
jgi:hypothetical protein